MKITKDYLRSLIKECMDDMGSQGMMPAMPQQMPSANIDPDGYEGRMAKTNLFKMAEYATELHNLIQDNENLEPWVEEKIAVASSMLDAVAHHMKYSKMNPGSR